MKSNQSLLLHQEVLLLALRDDEGTFQGNMPTLAVVGAMISELAMMGRIRIGSDKRRLVSVVNARSTDDAILDELLAKIVASSKQRAMVEWVGVGATLKNLTQRVAKQLCQLKILRNEEQKLMWVFTRQIYPEINPKHERAIKNRMSKLMFGQTAQHDDRTTALVALAKHTGLLRSNFDRDRLKRNQQRIARVANGDMYAARSARSAVQTLQAVLAVAAIMPAIASQ